MAALQAGGLRITARMEKVPIRENKRSSLPYHVTNVAAIAIASVFLLSGATAMPNNYPKPTFACPSAGFFPAPGSCTKFIRCVDFYGTGRHFSVFTFSCGPGTVYDQRIIGCNHPWAVPGLNCGPDETPGTNQHVRSYAHHGQNGHHQPQQQQQGHQLVVMHRPQPWYKTNAKPASGHQNKQQQPVKHHSPHQTQHYRKQPQPQVAPQKPGYGQQQSKPKQPIASAKKDPQAQRPSKKQPPQPVPSAKKDSQAKIPPKKQPTQPQSKTGQRPAARPQAGAKQPPKTAAQPSQAPAKSQPKVQKSPVSPKQTQPAQKKPPVPPKATKPAPAVKSPVKPKEPTSPKQHNQARYDQQSGAKKSPPVAPKPQKQAGPQGKPPVKTAPKPAQKQPSAPKQQPKPQQQTKASPKPTAAKKPTQPSKSTQKPITAATKPSKQQKPAPAKKTTPTSPQKLSTEGKMPYQRTGGSQPPCSPAKPQVTCTAPGFYAVPDSCTRFYRCVDWFGDGQNYGVFYFTCGPGTMFDDGLDTCTHPTATAMQDCPDCEMKDLFPHQFAQMQGGHYPVTNESLPYSVTQSPSSSSSSSTPGVTYGLPVTTGPSGFIQEGSPSPSSTGESQVGEELTTLPPGVPTIILTAAPDEEPEERQTEPTTLAAEDYFTENPADMSNNVEEPSGDCNAPGLYSVEGSCLKYYECAKNPDGTFRKQTRECPTGYLFDEQTQDCSSDALVISTRDCPNDELNKLYGGAEETVPTGTEPTLTSPYEPTSTAGGSQDQYHHYETSTDTPADREQQEQQGEPCKRRQSSATAVGKPSCSQDGFFPTPGTGCQKFYRCWRVGGGFSMAHFDCPPGTLFDGSIDVCNHPWAFSCNDEASEGYEECEEDGAPDGANDSNEVDGHDGYQPQQPAVQQGCTPGRPPKVECTEEGFFPVPGNCGKFYRCYQQGPTLAIAHFDCAPGTVFNDELDVCDHPWAVDCQDEVIGENCDSIEDKQATEQPQVATAQTDEPLTTPVDQDVGEKELFTTSATEAPLDITPTEPEQETTQQETSSDPTAATDPTDDLVTGTEPIDEVLTTEAPEVIITTPSETDLTTPGTLPDTTEPVSDATEATSQVTEDVEEREQTALTTGVTEPSTYTDVSTPATIETTSLASMVFSTVTDDFYMTTTVQYIPLMQCNHSGYYPLPGSCKKFYRCVDFWQDGATFTPFLFSCGPGTVYSPELNVCVHPEQLDPPRDCPDDDAEAGIVVTPHPMAGMAMGQHEGEPTAADCFVEGYFRHPAKCNNFYRCVDFYNNETFTVFHFECAPGTVFDDILDVCVHPESVDPPCAEGTYDNSTVTPADHRTTDDFLSDLTTESYDGTDTQATMRMSRMDDDMDDSTEDMIDLRQGKLDDDGEDDFEDYDDDDDDEDDEDDPDFTSPDMPSSTIGSTVTESTSSSSQITESTSESLATSSDEEETEESPTLGSSTTTSGEISTSEKATDGTRQKVTQETEATSTETTSSEEEASDTKSTASSTTPGTDGSTTSSDVTSSGTPKATDASSPSTVSDAETSTLLSTKAPTDDDKSTSASAEEDTSQTLSSASETASSETPSEPTATTDDRKPEARMLDEETTTTMSSTTQEVTTGGSTTLPTTETSTGSETPSDTPTTSTENSTTTEPAVVSTPAPTISFTLLCGSGRNLRHPVHCNRFYQCNFDGWNISISVSQCEGSKVFDQEDQQCVNEDEASEGSTDGCEIVFEPNLPEAVRKRRQTGDDAISHVESQEEHSGNKTSSVPMSFLVTQGIPMYCRQPGLYPFESDCEHFYRCPEDMSPVSLANGVYPRAELLRCPNGYSFDASSKGCLKMEAAKACNPDKNKLALVYLEYTPEEVLKAPVVKV